MSEEANTLAEDFIAFDFSLDDGFDDEQQPSTSPAKDESKQGSLGASSSKAGRKRNADEMLDDDNGYSKKQRIAAESRIAPWAENVDWDNCRNAADMLNEEVHAFVDYVSPLPQEHETRELVVEWIRRTIIVDFPDAEIIAFGSFATKLYLPTGDIDLVLRSPRIQRSGDVKTTLYKLAYTLRRANITDNVEVISKAKVPIVKFVTSHGRFAVDISINQVNGLGAVQIINQFQAVLPAVKPLVLVVKSFLSQRSMNEVFTGGLGSYSIVCLVISFLQMHPKIRRSAIDPMKNLGVLLVEFFELYGRFFQYDHVGLSLRAGGHYFLKQARGWSNHASPGLLSIEDPQDPSNDISSGSYGFMRVRSTLGGAFELLSAALCERGSALEDRRSKVYERTPSEMSLLSSIMGITTETIAKRRVVGELYQNGVLHRLLGVSVPSPEISPDSAKHGKNKLVSTGLMSKVSPKGLNGSSRHTRFPSSPPNATNADLSIHIQDSESETRASDPPAPRQTSPRKRSKSGPGPNSSSAPDTDTKSSSRKRKKPKKIDKTDDGIKIYIDVSGDIDSDDEQWKEASRGATETLEPPSPASDLSSVRSRRKSTRSGSSRERAISLSDSDSAEDEDGRYHIKASSKSKNRSALDIPVTVLSSDDESDPPSSPPKLKSSIPFPQNRAARQVKTDDLSEGEIPSDDGKVLPPVIFSSDTAPLPSRQQRALSTPDPDGELVITSFPQQPTSKPIDSNLPQSDVALDSSQLAPTIPQPSPPPNKSQPEQSIPPPIPPPLESSAPSLTADSIVPPAEPSVIAIDFAVTTNPKPLSKDSRRAFWAAKSGLSPRGSMPGSPSGGATPLK